MWMSRFDPSVDKPIETMANSKKKCPTFGAWSAERFHMDGKISHWADTVTAVNLAGTLEFHSASLNRMMKTPVAPSVVHMFNHQTHHRGQVHAMMTDMGLQAPVSDLFLMPEDA